MSLKLFTLLLFCLDSVALATDADNPYWFNLSLNKTALLSSTNDGSDSFNAINGKVIREPDKCATTEVGASNNWLAVDLEKSVYPALIVIHIYHSNYPSTKIRLGDSQDYSSNPLVKTLTLHTFKAVSNYQRKGRYLSIHYSGQLSICEVRAFWIPIDSLSIGKPAKTSIDPNYNGNHPWPAKAINDLNWNSVASSSSMKDSWIRIDLLDTHFVREVIIAQYPGHSIYNFALAIGTSLQNEGKLNPRCKTTSLTLGEAKSFRCNLKGRYVVYFTLSSGKFSTRASEIVVNPTHMANLAEANLVEFSGAKSGFNNKFFATDSSYGSAIMTEDLGTGHWIRLQLQNSYPVAKICLINIKNSAYWNLMTAFELRVGDSIENNGNNNPLCLPGEHSLEGKTIGSYFCDPRAIGKYVNIRQSVPDKAVALAEIAVYSEASPMIKEREKDREIWQKEVTLNCAAHGYPTPVLSWWKDNVVISNSDKLTVNKSGIYECWANNTHGEDFKPIHVSITSEVRVCVGSTEVTYDLGGKDVNVYPQAEATFHGHKWYRFSDITSMQYLKMSNNIPNLKKCRTRLLGEHPKLSDGVVARSVCVKDEQGDCQKQLNVRVRNCGAYYVYNLPSTQQVQGISYCFMKENKPSGNPSIASKVGGSDRALINHVLQREEEIQDSTDCLLMCSVAPSCKSFNHSKKEKMCELNSSSKRKSPKDFASRSGFVYFEKGKGMVVRRINEL